MPDEHTDQELINTLTRYFEDKQQLQLQEEAQTLAEGRSPQASEYLRAVVAILYGNRGNIPPPRRGFFDLFSPFTLVVAFMTIAFGVLGLFPNLFGGDKTGETAKTFLDAARL
jgi:hypothetical protein